MPTTGITTAIAVFAPVSKPLLPPLLLLDPSFASAAAEDDAAAASAELVVEVGFSVAATDVGSEVVVITTVTGVALSCAFVGDWVTTEVRICVVGSAAAAVAVLTTSLADSRWLVVSAAASDDEIAEEIEDATEDVISCDELGIVVWAELEMLDVVTAEAAVSVDAELMAAAAEVCSEGDRTYR
jgi:hypothetical protein